MRLYCAFITIVLGLNCSLAEVAKNPDTTKGNLNENSNNSDTSTNSKPFYKPQNETANAEKLLFSPLSSDSYSSLSSSMEELKKYDPKSEVEDIQDNDKVQTNTDLEEQYMLNNNEWNPESSVNFDDYAEIDHPHLKHRDLAIVVALFMAVLCLFSYVGLVLWRRTLEKRYGGLERLITEDDFTVDNI